MTKQQLKNIEKFAQKIQPYYELFNWKWCVDGDTDKMKIPTKERIVKTILELIKDCETCISTGGLQVVKDEEDGSIEINWSIEKSLFL